VAILIPALVLVIMVALVWGAVSLLRRRRRKKAARALDTSHSRADTNIPDTPLN